jgi:hypothetical protein
MEKSLLAFSRGTRQCLGIKLVITISCICRGYIVHSLARCELYVSTAALVLRVFPHMKLYDTTVADVKYDHDLRTAQAKKGSKGVRVAMRKILLESHPHNDSVYRPQRRR